MSPMLAPQYTPIEQPWTLATFQQRGVAVPFTTPALAGARLRMAEQHDLRELVVPHPAGARGHYVHAFTDIAGAYGLTVHDTLLLDELAGLRVVSPSEVRLAARAVARSGAAGHDARIAAQHAGTRDILNRGLTSNLLMQLILRQTEGIKCPPDELNRRGRDAIRRLAPALGCSAEQVLLTLADLAAACAPLGLADGMERPVCRLTLALLRRLAPALAALVGRAGNALDMAAEMVAACARATLTYVRHSWEQAEGMVADLPCLLALMLGSPAAKAATLRDLDRTAWLLDGWEQICLVFQLAAERGASREVLTEMAIMAPFMPREADDWAGVVVERLDRCRLRPSSAASDTSRSGGLVFELIARNERIRALAA